MCSLVSPSPAFEKGLRGLWTAKQLKKDCNYSGTQQISRYADSNANPNPKMQRYILFNKLKKLLFILLLTPFLTLPVLLMRILRPVLIIRIGILNVARIGDMLKAEIYLCLKNAGFYKKS